MVFHILRWLLCCCCFEEEAQKQLKSPLLNTDPSQSSSSLQQKHRKSSLLNTNSPPLSSSSSFSKSYPPTPKPLFLPPTPLPSTPTASSNPPRILLPNTSVSEPQQSSTSSPSQPHTLFDTDYLPVKIPIVIPYSILFRPPPPVPVTVQLQDPIKPHSNIKSSPKSVSSASIDTTRILINKNMASTNAGDQFRDFAKGSEENSHSQYNVFPSPIDQVEVGINELRLNQNPCLRSSPSMKYVPKSSEKKPQILKTDPTDVCPTPFPPPSLKPPPPLSSPSSALPNGPQKTNYVRVLKGTAPFKELIQEDIVCAEEFRDFAKRSEESSHSQNSIVPSPLNQVEVGTNKPRPNQNPCLKPSPSMKYIPKSLKKKPQIPKVEQTDVCTTPFTPPCLKPPPLSSLGTSQSSILPNAPHKVNYVWVPKGTNPLYPVPEDFKELIQKDIVPEVLRRTLTPSTYKNYFAALLYAEDFYCEKWSDYCLKDVTLQLHKAAIYAKSSKNKNVIDSHGNDKVFVAFQIDSIPERRPFLLSRDFVLLKPSGNEAFEPFQGILYRVVKSTLVLAEFGDDFYVQHYPECKYNVSFTFNRVCLKRSHQALAAATETLFLNFLFPRQRFRIDLLDPPPVIPSYKNLNPNQVLAVYNISRITSSPPFLIEGPLSVICKGRKPFREMKLSATGIVVQEAVQQIYRTSPGCRILINAPTNDACDLLMRSLKKEIPEFEIFRANAAFRELDDESNDILPFCRVKEECFTCPPLEELRRFKVVFSTYMSSFRVHNEGIDAGHFSHIFMVDSSSTMEPETMVPLANLVNEKTVVVVTGSSGNCSSWVQSDIARQCGLQISYFQRLLGTEPYCRFDPMFAVCVGDNDVGLDHFNEIKSIS